MNLLNQPFGKKYIFFFFRNEISETAQIMHSINEDGDLPNLSIRTARNLIHDLGFIF